MSKPLSEQLKALKFVEVLYVMQKDTRGKEIGVAPRGRPYTQGHFRGVTVVYDEKYRPWIRPWPLTFEQMLDLDLLVGGKRAFVPHVDDGGKFITSKFPELGKITLFGPRHKPR